MAVSLGRLGFWTGQYSLAGVSDEQLSEFAGQLEQAGYGAIWLGSATAGLRFAEQILSTTTGLVYATGILNMWIEPAKQVVASYRRLSAYSDRVLAGIGVGHRERPDNEHTRQAREILGPGPLLAPEQKVVLETDPARARQIGRQHLCPTLGLVNYRSNFLRLSFTEQDLTDGGSDRLVDATIAWGKPATVAERISEHHRAGADHVAVQVLGVDNPLPLAELREISAALAG